MTPAESTILHHLQTRGASFPHSLPHDPASGPLIETLFSLLEKGLVHADGFAPVRNWIEYNNNNGAQAFLPVKNVKQRALWQARALATGRWELAFQLPAPPFETLLHRAFDRAVVLCRETCGDLDWGRALEKLRVWEYTGVVRRGYFIQGLSGAQFIRDADYYAALTQMDETDEIKNTLFWLNAADPAQPWGKSLSHLPGRACTNTRGTLVALRFGLPVCVLENQGKTLRVFEQQHLGAALSEFASAFKQRRVFSTLRRVTVKHHPPDAIDALLAAGFLRQMMDYELWV